MSSIFIEVDRWLSLGGAALDPTAMQFRATLATDGAKDCAGCVFRAQASSICRIAALAAKRAGMRDCDEVDVETGRTFIYVEIKPDPRQLRVTTEG